MKKQLFLVMLALASLQMFALEIEEGKFYTIRNHSSTPAYMADNNADDNQIKCVATITDACFWEFIPTSNTNCYYVRNQKTGRYIQGYSSKEEMVLLGTNGVEYQVESFTDEDGKFGFSYTGNTPHDFSSETIGLNLKGVQEFMATLIIMVSVPLKDVGISISRQLKMEMVGIS